MDTLRQRNEDQLLSLPNVVGVGAGKKEVNGKETNTLCIRVYVEKKVALDALSTYHIVPPRIEGIKTDVIEIGRLEAQENTKRMRPARPGISIGHYKVTAGTLGCLVKDRDSARVMILSNNHVLANSNDAQRDDVILQPSKHDGGDMIRDRFARLVRWVPIEWANWSFWAFWRWGKKRKVNYVDAAIAFPNLPSHVDPKIVDIGVPVGVGRVEVGMEVQKSGRTTGHTRGKVIDTSATVTVNYGRKNPKPAKFRNQIIFSAMSKGGDSGSLILNMQNEAVSLLYAGSPKVTIGNQIQVVLDALNVDLVT